MKEEKEMKCSKCGAELSADTKFCSYCGHKIEETTPTPVAEYEEIPPISHDKLTKEKKKKVVAPKSQEKKKIDVPKSLADKRKEKGLTLWDKLSMYGKIMTIAMLFFVLLCLVALFTGKTIAVVIAVVQIILAIVSILMHKGVISLEEKKHWIKWLVLCIAILFTGLNVMSYSWDVETSTVNQPLVSTGESAESSEKQLDMLNENNNANSETAADIQQSKTEKSSSFSITKGTEYAYMTDEWNVYIATAISNDIIKIENWDKTMSNSKSVSHEYDVGTFKINDEKNGFYWVDEEHTAFVMTVKDKKNWDFRKGKPATFTININDSDKNKGSDYSEKIACFSYQNDDWHLYRAIPLTKTLIKIETWYRGSSIGKFLFGYDLCLIDTESEKTDFEWTDNEHTSFSITMKDEKNKHEWKKETFVVFVLENEEYTNFNVKDYLGKWEIGDAEAAVPVSESDYKYKNYKDVQKELEGAGFTNISTEILYDIVLGWTDEGEVDSVSIDGRTDYEKKEVFKKNAPVIITYHMKEEDNPNKPVEKASTEPDKTTREVGEGDVIVPAAEPEYEFKNYKNVEKELKSAGFTNISTEILYDIILGWTDEGEVESVSIGGRTDYEKGEIFKKESPVIITYHMKEEDDPNKADESESSKFDDVISKLDEYDESPSGPNLTVDNCPELANMLANKAEIDPSYSSFATMYKGRNIEFDGRIDYCTNYEDYNTRFDYLVSAGDYDPDHQVGPSFKFENVAHYDLNTDLETVSVGLNVHIIAEVKSFDSNSGLFYLEPIAVTGR